MLFDNLTIRSLPAEIVIGDELSNWKRRVQKTEMGGTTKIRYSLRNWEEFETVEIGGALEERSVRIES